MGFGSGSAVTIKVNGKIVDIDGYPEYKKVIEDTITQERLNLSDIDFKLTYVMDMFDWILEQDYHGSGVLDSYGEHDLFFRCLGILSFYHPNDTFDVFVGDYAYYGQDFILHNCKVTSITEDGCAFENWKNGMEDPEDEDEEGFFERSAGREFWYQPTDETEKEFKTIEDILFSNLR